MTSYADATAAKRARTPKPWYPQACREEWLADAIVHAVGLGLALAGGVWLVAYAHAHGDVKLTTALTVYVAGLVAMISCSALYNTNTNQALRDFYEGLDLSAIFLKIAATYTPIMLILLGGAWSVAFLGLIWTLALGGVALRLLARWNAPRIYIAIYVALGWLALTVLKQLAAAVSPTGLALLAAGGLLYTIGVVFHVWERLKFNSAIWHGFVVAAASCHFAAIAHEVVTVG